MAKKGIMQRIAERVKALAPGGPRVSVLGRRSEPPALGTQDFLEAYDSNPWVRAMAGRVAQRVGETEWRLGRTDRADRNVPRNHPLLQLLRRPNPLMSGTSLMRVTQLSIDLAGDAFWLLERNGFDMPVRAWPIPPHWVSDLPKEGEPSYKIQWQAWRADIPERQIVWIHDPSPSNPYGRGRGILQALSDEVTTDEHASKHALGLFFNRATPEIVVMDPGADEDEIDSHERHWNSRLRGLYRAFKPYFANRKLEFWQPQQMNLENLTLVPLRKFERDIQLQCWGIPPEQLGIIEKSNRATAEASNYIFELNLIRPRRRFVAEEIGLKLAPFFDERIEVGFVDTVPKDKEGTLKVMTANPVAFIMDEWRELAGLEPEGGELGNARIVPLNSYITIDPLDNSLRPNQPGAAANDDDEDDAEDDTTTDEDETEEDEDAEEGEEEEEVEA